MAVVSFSGQINLSTVLTNMGLGAGANTNRSLRSVTITALGNSNPARSNVANSLCMPYEAHATNSLGRNGVRAPGATWVQSEANWGENRLSEFRGAYTGKPRLSLSYTRAGNRSQVYINCTASGSEAAPGGPSPQTGPYYFLITGPGSTTGMNVWRVAQNGNNFTQYLVTSTSYGSYYTVRVQDYQGCGNQREFALTIRYY